MPRLYLIAMCSHIRRVCSASRFAVVPMSHYSTNPVPDRAAAEKLQLVILASACWDVATPVNVHHIARRFAAAGHRMLFVESTGLRQPSVRSMHDRSRVVRRLGGWWRGARQVEENLTVLSPLTLPAHWPQPARSLAARWLGAAVRHAMKQHDFQQPILWAFLPGYYRTVERIPHQLLVYHCVDDYAANPGVDAAMVRDDERNMLNQADLVFASSKPLAERLGKVRNDVHLLPNVADVTRFASAVEDELPEPTDLAGVGRPRAVYVGNLAAYRFDGELLAQVAERLPSVHFILIGPPGVGDLDAAAAHWPTLGKRPNIHMLGPRPHHELPAYLAHCDAGMIPFLDNDHTRSSFPLKLWEMLGAGLAVVGSDLPALRGVAPPEMLRVARDADSFADALQAVISDAGRGREQRLAVARQHDWSQRIEELRALLGSMMK